MRLTSVIPLKILASFRKLTVLIILGFFLVVLLLFDSLPTQMTLKRSPFRHKSTEIPEETTIVLSDCPQVDYSGINEYLSERRKFLISSNVSLLSEQFETIAKETGIQKGGSWKPKNCIAKYQTCVVVPYRNRSEHLPIFLTYIHEFLQLQKLDYRIVIVEQSESADFNRGKLMNVGYAETKKSMDCPCFIIHDIDMLPENIENTYACFTDEPRHMAVSLDKYLYMVIFKYYFGGVLAMTSRVYELINGFSNRFYGWGAEDDDLYIRVTNRGLNITSCSTDICRYTTLKHNSAKMKIVNYFTYIKSYFVPDDDGLSNLNYTIIDQGHLPLYTWIKVDV